MGSSAVCGNGLLEPGETCTSCATDCVVQSCTATTPTVAFAFDLNPPLGQNPTSATVLVGYRSNLLSIPGLASASTVLARVVAPAPLPNPFIRNDANYAISVVYGRPTPIETLFTITFDRCTGAAAPSLSDVSCAVLGCSSGGGPINGCTCSARVP